jgi:hypothetical protein
MNLTNEQLLAEVEDILRTMPPRATIRHDLPENFAWIGRVSALISNWSPPMAIFYRGYLETFQGQMAQSAGRALQQIITLLHQARHDLRMKTVGPANVAIGQGMVFDYFDEVRQIVEGAKQDILFVDPYLDAEFVARYLPHVAEGVTVRLLGRERLGPLLPAVDAFVLQTGAQVAVRSATGFHDRYVLVDGVSCYQSGASFKDGAKKAPTTLTQITDALVPVLTTYEALWSGAKIER